MAKSSNHRQKFRWHIMIFLLPAVLVYTLVLVFPLVDTLRHSFFSTLESNEIFVGLENFHTLFGDELWARQFWNALLNNIWFFIIHLCVQIPIAILLAMLISGRALRVRGLYHGAILFPALLSFVIVGLIWQLILSPLWGITPSVLDLIGLNHLFAPWLTEETHALVALSLISAWRYVGIPVMLIYASLISIPDEILEAGECDGVTGLSAFWKIKLPLILPTLGIISILTFVAGFNAFDLVYVTQGTMAGPDFSTDLLGTFMYRTLFGFQSQAGNTHMAATIATVMLLITMSGIGIYLLGIQKRLRR